MTNKAPFWKEKSLAEMTQEEWESLCDGCGKCCLVLLLDDETEAIWETDVACPLFDASCRQCTDYENRSQRMPDCITLKPDNIEQLKWMPKTCAYRLLAEGKDLYPWHPLISGDRQSVVKAGIAVSPDLPSEALFDDEQLTKRIVRRRV